MLFQLSDLYFQCKRYSRDFPSHCSRNLCWPLDIQYFWSFIYYSLSVCHYLHIILDFFVRWMGFRILWRGLSKANFVMDFFLIVELFFFINILVEPNWHVSSIGLCLFFLSVVWLINCELVYRFWQINKCSMHINVLILLLVVTQCSFWYCPLFQ